MHLQHALTSLIYKPLHSQDAYFSTNAEVPKFKMAGSYLLREISGFFDEEESDINILARNVETPMRPMNRSRTQGPPTEISSSAHDEPSSAEDEPSSDNDEPLTRRSDIEAAAEPDSSRKQKRGGDQTSSTSKVTRTKIRFDNPEDFLRHFVVDLERSMITKMWLHMSDDTVTHVTARFESASSMFREMLIDDPVLLQAFGCNQLPIADPDPKAHIAATDLLKPYERFCLVFTEHGPAHVGVLNVLQGVYQTFMKLRKAEHPSTPPTGREARIIAGQHDRSRDEVLQELQTKWGRDQKKMRLAQGTGVEHGPDE
jgi:hypothetical protein